MQIWKDYIVEIGEEGDAFTDFVILIEETPIYIGRAYRRPNESRCKVRLNDICADYLANPLPSSSESEIDFPEKTFTISWGEENYEEVTFIADYSYEDEPEKTINAPIRNKYDQRMPIFFAPVEDTDVTIITDSEAIISTYAGGLVHPIVPDTIAGIKKFGDIDIVPSCHRFALYYSNAFGGWDGLIMEGNYKEIDTLTRHERVREYDNREPENRGRVNYANEVIKAYELNTGWLSDEEAARMHHLIGSTDVYLLDMEKGMWLPVVLTANTCEYKTIKTEGKAVNYTIAVEIAHNRVRK